MMKISAQQFVLGKVTSENNDEISNVLVINLSNRKQVFTSRNGDFFIEVKLNDELRFTKEGYERISIKINQENFSNPLKITLIKTEVLIEEVEITYQPTGNLEEDTKHFGDKKKLVKLKGEMSKYILQKSDLSVLSPKHGEFVQPIGQGFVISKIGFKWDTFDLFVYLQSNLGKEYFYSLGLTNLEIRPFVFFALSDFEKNEILRFGYCSVADLARFQVHAEKKILVFKNKK